MSEIKNNLKDPPALIRWLVLLIISIAMCGNYYIYDSISPLADLLKTQLNFTDSNIGTLNAIYSIPNIFMVLIGGLIIDRIGTKKSSLIFSVLVLLGSLITLLQGNIYLMATGRLIFGLGAESMIVAITTVIARWFKGKELSFAFGINLTIARLGSFLALNSPSWGKGLYSNWQSPLWVSVGFGIIAVSTLVIYYLVDYYSEKRFALEKEGAQDKVLFGDIFKYSNLRLIIGAIFAVSFVSLYLIYQFDIISLITGIIVIVVISFLQFSAFSKSFWFITFLCITFYSAMFPFQTFAVKFFQDVHYASREVGGFLSSMLTVAAMVFTPLFGLLADKIGKRSLLMMFGSLLIVPVYLMMGYGTDVASFLGLKECFFLKIPFFDVLKIPTNLLIPMSIMGIAFSLIPAVMWPSVALVVKQSKLGTAYGLMTMIQNIGLAGFNLLIGWANDTSGAGFENPGGYLPGMWIFSACGLFGLFFAFMLRRNEKGPNAHGLEFGSIHKNKQKK